jgi:CubicO group peptidase (beta-lactamase class C family)
MALGCGSAAPAPTPRLERPAVAPVVGRARRDLQEALLRAHEKHGGAGLVVLGFDRTQVRFEASFGSAAHGKVMAIDRNTTFEVASVSKLITAVGLATLVRDAKLGWDDPLTSVAPSLRLHRSFEADPPTVRDVLSHRTGLAMWAGDLLWYRTEKPWTFIRDRARHLEREAPIRTTFSYSNILYTALREAFETRGRRTWEDMVRAEILEPLGMTRTLLSDAEAAAARDRAVPITTIDGTAQPAFAQRLDAIAPAGGVRSTAADLVRFAQALLRSEERDSLVPASVLVPMWEPHLALPLSPQRRRITPETIMQATGLGCHFVVHAGRRIVMHGGALPGIATLVAIAPEDGVGVVILSNADDGALTRIALYSAFDDLLGLEPADWSARFDAIAAAAKAEEPRPHEARTYPLEARDEKALAGTYDSKVYGELRITAEDHTLKMHLEHHPGVIGTIRARTDAGYASEIVPKHLGPTPLSVARKGASVSAFVCSFGAELVDGLRYRFERSS